MTKAEKDNPILWKEIVAKIKSETSYGTRSGEWSARKAQAAVKRYKKAVGHKSDPGVMSGRYPQKAATEILKLLDNLESNAEYKGMDLDRLKIINAAVHKGRILKRFIPRAMGRATPKNDVLTHVELVAQEM